MAKTSLPPGFRFHPTDVELVVYYLKRKITGKPFRFEAIADVELYKYAPWDLPDKSCLKSRDKEWFFFCGRDKKYANGFRMNRATENGYWKTTGKDRSVLHNSRTVGMKKTLVFHIGRAPNGDRTDWVMHEYRLLDEELARTGIQQDVFVLCKIFHKSGPGPKNGEHHGASFNELEWEEDMDLQDGNIPLVSSPGPIDEAIAAPVPRNSVAGAEVAEASSTLAPTEADDDLVDQLLDILDEMPAPSINASGEAYASFLPEGPFVYDAVYLQTRNNRFHNVSGLADPGPIDGHDSSIVNNELCLNSAASELATENYVELNDLSFLLDGYNLPQLAVPSYPALDKRPFIDCPSLSITNFSMAHNGRGITSAVDDYLLSGSDMNNGPPPLSSETADYDRDADLLYDSIAHCIDALPAQADTPAIPRLPLESLPNGSYLNPSRSFSSTLR